MPNIITILRTLLQGLVVVAAITTLWSGLSYVWHGSRRAQACREA